MLIYEFSTSYLRQFMTIGKVEVTLTSRVLPPLPFWLLQVQLRQQPQQQFLHLRPVVIEPLPNQTWRQVLHCEVNELHRGLSINVETTVMGWQFVQCRMNVRWNRHLCL